MNINNNEIRNNYSSSINNALKFIDDNLESELSLELISEVAHYSPFHFHRIFKIMTNETLNTYITRKRIEKAASTLFRQKEITISEISLRYGFNSISSFSRAFKKFYSISPSEFRKISPSKYSKICQVESKIGQENTVFEEYICNINNLKNWINMNAKIEIKKIQQLDLAFISHLGEHGLDITFNKLIKWATPHGLMDRPNLKLLTMYHDSYKVTSPDKIRKSVGIVLDEPIHTSGEIGLTTIEQGKYIVGSFEISPQEFEKSWSGLFVWMNENGYKKSEQNPFEIYHNNFNDHPEKKCIVDLYIPIQ
ncbi:GyrI-like domain-containing protein [Aquimarina sp. AU474]|uniref:AraC family transcriptional regulator n=1 Tax=Aquimarina sp. AU474 TaxID=2108529 RepID=UPI000D69D60F|nr:GyrI-like domain-containing protein [Aquimarina sp. AU474]